MTAVLAAIALGGCTLSGGAPAPTVTSVLPSSEPAGTSATVTVVGTGFDLSVATTLSGSTAKAGAVTVTIGGVTLTKVARYDAEHITGALDGSLAPGSYQVSVTLPDGQTATLDKAFTVTAPMQVALTLPGQLAAGATGTGTLTLTSLTSAGADLSLLSLAPQGTSALSVTAPTLPATLAPFATASVDVALSLPADATDTSATIDARVRWNLGSMSGEADASASITLVPASTPAIDVAFGTTPPAIEVGQSADLPLTVTNSGNVALSSVAVTVTGDAQAGVGTQPTLSATSLAASDTATGTVSITGVAAGTSTITADASGDDGSGGAPITSSVTATVDVKAGPAPALTFGTVPTTAAAGTPVGIDVTLTNNGDVDLTGATVSLATTNAVVAPASQLRDVAAGSSATLTFTVTPTAILTAVGLTATASGTSALSGATFTAQPATASIGSVTGTTATALSFSTAALTAPISTCSGTVTVGIVDGSGQPAISTSDTPVTLTSDDATLVFFSDAACTTQATSVVIPAGTSTVDLAFVSTTVGTPTLTAASTGLTSATQTETVIPPPPASLAFTTAPLDVQATTCAGPVTVEQLDASGTPATSASDTTVVLTADVANLTFYADAACGTTVSTVAIPAGQTTTDLYFVADATGSPTITAAATGVVQATQTETVTGPPATALTFVNAPVTGSTGVCLAPVTVGLVDAGGNPAFSTTGTVVTLTSDDTTLTLFGDAVCGMASGTVTIPAGQSSIDVSFQTPTFGTPTITATAAGLTSASQLETVNPPPPVDVRIVDPAPGSGRTELAGTSFVVDVGALTPAGHTVSQIALSVTSPAQITTPATVAETTQTAVALFTVSIPAGTTDGTTVTLTATAKDDTGATATAISSVVTSGPATLVSLACAPSNLSLLQNEGSQVSLLATMSDGTLVEVSGQASWVSSDATVATVGDGVVDGVAVGTAQVSGTWSGQTASCSVTVAAANYATRPARVLLAPGGIGALRFLQYASGVPSDQTSKPATTWSSNDPTVVSVDATGGLTAGQAGTATVTACNSTSGNCGSTLVIVASDPVIDPSIGGPVGISGSLHFASLTVEPGGVVFGYGASPVDLQVDTSLVVGQGGMLLADGQAAPAATVAAPDVSIRGYGGDAGPGGGGGGAGSGDGVNSCNGSMCGGAGTPAGQDACRTGNCAGGNGGGPGGGGGAPATVSSPAGNAGGGGGAVGAGGRGGSTTAATYAGAAGTTPGTTAASGGSGGGGGDGGGGTEGPGGGGGGGGGALAITANGTATVRIDGLIGARGGAGGDELNAAFAGPGGGGAGGTVTVTATSGSITGTGRVSARGGRGGNGALTTGACGGGGGGGGGSVTLSSAQPGPFLLVRALGGPGGLACGGGGTAGEPGAAGTVTRQ